MEDELVSVEVVAELVLLCLLLSTLFHPSSSSVMSAALSTTP